MSTPRGPVTSFPAVDSFTVANIPMPGKWTLTDAKKVFGWQIQQGYGLSGAFVYPAGDKLVVAKFHGEFWDEGDVFAFKQARKLVLKKPTFSLGVVTAALGINHPELKAMGVDAVVVAEVGPLLQSEGGLWTISVDFLQYRAPLPVPPKPKTKIPDVAPPIPTAKTAQEIELQKLQGTAAALVAKL